MMSWLCPTPRFGGYEMPTTTDGNRSVRRGASPLQSTTGSHARYVGRVGALALALGVGVAIAAMPVGYADTRGSGGSAGSSDAGSPDGSTPGHQGQPTSKASPQQPDRSNPATDPVGIDDAAGAPKSAITAGKPDVTAAKPDIATAKTDVTAAKPDDTGAKPDDAPLDSPVDSPTAPESGAATNDAGQIATAPTRSGTAKGSVDKSTQPPRHRRGRTVTSPGEAGIRPSREAAPTMPAESEPAAARASEPSLPEPARDEPATVAPGSAPEDVVGPPKGAAPGSLAAAAPAASAPVMTATARTAARRDSVDSVGPDLLSWFSAGGSDGAPAAAPLMWTAAALSRRELAGSPRTAAPAATVSTGEPATPATGSVSGVLSQTQAQSQPQAAAAIADPLTAFVRVFVGNGTKDNPNAGLLLGNGYSYSAPDCPSGACNGGNAGLLWGDGGSGVNGGRGGAAHR